MEWCLIPKELGVGVYISDSEDSQESAIERWLAGGRGQGSTHSGDAATTAYASARETSVEEEEFLSVGDSSDDSGFFLDDEKCDIPKAIPFPDPLTRTTQHERAIQFQTNLQERLLKYSLRFDARLGWLETKRRERCAQLQREHLERSATIVLNRRKAKLGAVQTKLQETAEAEKKTKDQGKGQSVKTEDAAAGNGKDATTQSVTGGMKMSGLGAGGVGTSTSRVVEPSVKPEADAVGQTSVRTQPDLVRNRGPESSQPALMQTGRDSSSLLATNGQTPSQPSHHPVQPNNQKETPTNIPSDKLLRKSEEMNVPRSLPPPHTLFSLSRLEAENEEGSEKQVALHAAQTAIEFEAYHKRIAQEMVNSMGGFGVNISNRAVCKAIDKNMKLDVMQISATETQVQAKASKIVRTISDLAGPAGTVYAYAQLSRHLISKCAGISDSLVFAVAKTTVKVMEHHPHLLSMLLSLLHEVSVLTVPKYYSAPRTHDTLLEKLGFREILAIDHMRKETADEFITRQSGYVKFYAAIIELNSPVHGLEFGWSYMSRMLNNLPPSRITASALMSFLSVAGHSLFVKYKKQFYKVLLYIHSRFLVQLATSNDGESQAVYSRLQTYLQNRHFANPPECKAMPEAAASRTVFA